MDIIIGKKIKIKELNRKTDATIINYLHKNGIIKGKKNIHKNYSVPIIEFKDHTRIWMMPQELEIL